MAHFRLAIVTPRFWPLIDDTALHLLRMAEALLAAGQTVTVVTPRWKRSWPEHMLVGPVPLVRLAGDGLGGIGTLRWMYALSKWLSQQTLDAVLVSGLKHEAYVALRPSLPTSSKTILIAGEDCLAWQQTAMLGVRTLARCRQAPLITAATDAHAGQLLAAGYDEQRLTVVPRGALGGHSAGPGSRAAARAALAAINFDLATTENAFVALAIGHLDDQHRFGDAVRAWRIVTARRSESRLWLVGDGPARERLYRQIGDLDQRFRAFLPGVFETYDDLLAASNALLVPGWRLAPPPAMLDAQTAGVPVIAADSPAARQCIRPGETGWIYPLGDAQGLAAAVLGLIEHPEQAASYAAAAMYEARGRQTPESEAAAYLDQIERLRSS